MPLSSVSLIPHCLFQGRNRGAGYRLEISVICLFHSGHRKTTKALQKLFKKFETDEISCYFWLQSIMRQVYFLSSSVYFSEVLLKRKVILGPKTCLRCNEVSTINWQLKEDWLYVFDLRSIHSCKSIGESGVGFLFLSKDDLFWLFSWHSLGSIYDQFLISFLYNSHSGKIFIIHFCFS